MKSADDAIARWCEVGHTRWPSITVSPTTLAAHLDRLGIPHADHAYADDLYLACACCAGDAAAIGVFEQELAPVMRAAIRRLDSAEHFVDEVVQVVRERVLVAPPGGVPRISGFAGQGPLRAWVRIAAMRIAMNMLRDRHRDVLVDDDRLFETIAADHGERGSAEKYREAATEALRAAFTALSARERNLLRMHHLHGLTVDELAPTLGVHRATVARWIAAAREHLLDETRASLGSRLEVGASTIESIVRGIASQVDVSVVRLLADD
ncbi:MAG: sigma-70 family RNA polymerase sigma factor [Myxococcota bacterium]|nr:sigma-70 family RNA polymerase sigma factor [Myxococcota bacterium]